MKIFNWVHRRFHQKDELDGELKNAEFVSHGNDTQALLLENVVPADVLDGWREGILTIGTFGFEPLKDFKQQIKECPTTDDDHKENDEEEECDDDDDDDDDEQVYSSSTTSESEWEKNELEDENEVNPLVFAAYKSSGLGKEIGGSSDCDDQNVSNINDDIVDLILMINNVDSIPDDDEHGGLNSNVSDQYNYDKMKKKERTTLADLFSADVAAANQGKKKGRGQGKVVIDEAEIMMTIKKGVSHGKIINNGFSFAKKLIPRLGEDSRPITKLIRETKSLMTKMLKRKIHPDVEGKIQKKFSETKLNVSGHKFEANESVSLLQTQDVVL